eukprot:CAMPEP_0117446110 /NCGR_PEP_ID=MMETSP0759-20121206/6156_1 /TAXON_ID=63605 /ORGANISM="Percolomonas cosmopolitus, Strain WS" /LENGTH=343 /DNA_ID=CAMNT_0005238335 /DNA_START=297 /DNA_END=1328 /DNA_ORIENTATION=-
MARGNGRRKIPMSLIVDKSTRKTTYKKRKNGLFKKAMELSILTDCKVMVFVFNENNTDISEYSTVDPREMMQMYVEQAVLPHERFSNDDYDTIGLKPAERKRLGLNAPGKREITELPIELQNMQRSPAAQAAEKAKLAQASATGTAPTTKKRAAAKRTRSKTAASSSAETKKPTKKRKKNLPSNEGTETQPPHDGSPSAAASIHANNNDDQQYRPPISTQTYHSGVPQALQPPMGHPVEDSNHIDHSGTGELIDTNVGHVGGLSSGPLSMPQFSLEDPNKAGPLMGIRRQGTFSSPAFRIGLTPSPGAIQTPRSGDDIHDNINSYFPAAAAGGSMYQTQTPKG